MDISMGNVLHSPFNKRASETWNNLPEIAGSKWAFIGVIAGAAAIVLIILIIAIACCCRRSRRKSRMRHAAQGSDLSAFHPAPSFGHNTTSNAHRTKFTPVRSDDHDDDDAFVAHSPRDSFAYSRPAHKYNSSDVEHVRMNKMYGGANSQINYYADGAAQHDDPYMQTYNYSAGGGYGGYGDESFVEPQYVQSANNSTMGAMTGQGTPYQYAPTTPAPSSVYAQTTAPPTSLYSPPLPATGFPAQQMNFGPPSTYPQQPVMPEQQQQVAGEKRQLNMSQTEQQVSSPTSAHYALPQSTSNMMSSQQNNDPQSTRAQAEQRQMYAPSVAETAPPPYIPYQGPGASGSSGADVRDNQTRSPPTSPPPPPRKTRLPGGANV